MTRPRRSPAPPATTLPPEVARIARRTAREIARAIREEIAAEFGRQNAVSMASPPSTKHRKR